MRSDHPAKGRIDRTRRPTAGPITVLEQASIVIEQACSAGRHRIGLGLSSWLA